uniref:Uncharacterized protein n=1 Tax=Anguilla anguilla TaxID=7936 RepID=A0A0E9SBN7_ANGAN
MDLAEGMGSSRPFTVAHVKSGLFYTT